MIWFSILWSFFHRIILLGNWRPFSLFDNIWFHFLIISSTRHYFLRPLSGFFAGQFSASSQYFCFPTHVRSLVCHGSSPLWFPWGFISMVIFRLWVSMVPSVYLPTFQRPPLFNAFAWLYHSKRQRTTSMTLQCAAISVLILHLFSLELFSIHIEPCYCQYFHRWRWILFARPATLPSCRHTVWKPHYVWVLFSLGSWFSIDYFDTGRWALLIFS